MSTTHLPSTTKTLDEVQEGDHIRHGYTGQVVAKTTTPQGWVRLTVEVPTLGDHSYIILNVPTSPVEVLD